MDVANVSGNWLDEGLVTGSIVPEYGQERIAVSQGLGEFGSFQDVPEGLVPSEQVVAVNFL